MGDIHDAETDPELMSTTFPRLRTMADRDFSHVSDELKYLMKRGLFKNLLDYDKHKFDYLHMDGFFIDRDHMKGVDFTWQPIRGCTCYACKLHQVIIEEVVVPYADLYDVLTRVRILMGVSIMIGKEIANNAKSKI